MKYAIMSDVHANPRAFAVALADAKSRGCVRHILLGDLTGYGYDASESIVMAQRACDVVLMGNHDSACLDLETDVGSLLNPNYALDHRQRKQITDAQVKWLRSRPYSHEEENLAFAHGDFVNPRAWNYVFDTSGAVRNFLSNPADLLFCGHTHHAAAWEMIPEKGIFRPKCDDKLTHPAVKPESISFTAREARRYLVNVGSVGYPRNDLCMTYVIYDSDSRRVTFRRLPFDFKSYIMDMIAHKVSLPDWLQELLMQAR